MRYSKLNTKILCISTLSMASMANTSYAQSQVIDISFLGISKEQWELFSYIATTFGIVFAIIGLIVVIAQLKSQSQQGRLEALRQVYSQLDTNEARATRQWIYHANESELTIDFLHKKGNELSRGKVEDTLAVLERLAYPILNNQVPEDDAFNLYAGVLLSTSFKLWPYVESQRQMRKESGLRKRLSYRRYLEALVRKWAPKYARACGRKIPTHIQSTSDMLNSLFGKFEGNA